MAVICVDPTETGIADQSFSGSEDVSATTAGSWSAYSLFVNNAETVWLWDSMESEFYGQTRTQIVSGGEADWWIRFRSPNNTINVYLNRSAGGYLQAVSGGNTWVSTYALTHTTWYYIQWHITINDSTGVIQVWVNGEQVLNQSGIDTRQDTGTNGDKCDRIGLVGSNSFGARFDDWVIDDASLPDWLGIEALVPNAAGDVTGLTRGGSDSGSNYGQVDEKPPNSDTDYVYDTVVNDYDLYNIPSTQWSTVDFVALAIRARSGGAGASLMAHMLKADTNDDASADTEYTGSDIGLTSTYKHYVKIYDQQPDATSWTPAKVNALQIGVKVR